MADSDKDPTGGDPNKETTSAEPEVKKEEVKPEEPTASAEKEVKDDKGAEPEKPAAKDIADYSLVELIAARDDLGQHIQSTKDKATSSASKKIQDDLKRKATADKRSEDAAELKRLIEEEDYDAIGRQTAKDVEQEEELVTQAVKFNAILEKTIRDNPEFAALGEDVISEVFNAVGERGGNVVDFMGALSKRLYEENFSKTLDTERKTMRQELSEELDAKLAEHGLTKREQATKDGETPNPDISGGTGGKTQEEVTYTKASELYGEGEMSWEEFKPFKEAHDKERKR